MNKLVIKNTKLKNTTLKSIIRIAMCSLRVIILFSVTFFSAIGVAEDQKDMIGNEAPDSAEYTRAELKKRVNLDKATLEKNAYPATNSDAKTRSGVSSSDISSKDSSQLNAFPSAPVMEVNSADYIFSFSHYLSDLPCQFETDNAPELVVIHIPLRLADRLEWTPIAIGRCEVTVAEFMVFFDDYAERSPDDLVMGDYECLVGTDKTPISNPSRYPADCIDYDLARLYVAWLSEKTGLQYRLPTMSEWRAAAGAPDREFSSWFTVSTYRQCEVMNGADRSLESINVLATGNVAKDSQNYALCSDGHSFTAPVASFKPNKNGLYDMFGNVAEWVDDDECARRKEGGCATEEGLLAGGNWNTSPILFEKNAIVAFSAAEISLKGVGFRVVRELK